MWEHRAVAEDHGGICVCVCLSVCTHAGAQGCLGKVLPQVGGREAVPESDRMPVWGPDPFVSPGPALVLVALPWVAGGRVHILDLWQLMNHPQLCIMMSAKTKTCLAT